MCGEIRLLVVFFPALPSQDAVVAISGGETPGRNFSQRETGSSGCQKSDFSAHGGARSGAAGTRPARRPRRLCATATHRGGRGRETRGGYGLSRWCAGCFTRSIRSRTLRAPRLRCAARPDARAAPHVPPPRPPPRPHAPFASFPPMWCLLRIRSPICCDFGNILWYDDRSHNAPQPENEGQTPSCRFPSATARRNPTSPTR